MPATTHIQHAAREGDAMLALRIRVHGIVQGIGFRPATESAALPLCASPWKPDSGRISTSDPIPSK